MQKVPFCKGLVGIEAVVEARASRMAGVGKGEGFLRSAREEEEALPHA